jgi:hypothetical protein
MPIFVNVREIMREASKLLCLREDLKTATLRDERSGEKRREGRAARNFSEEKFTCSQILSRALLCRSFVVHSKKTNPFCRGFVFLIYFKYG